jgi:hypothetical protein
VPPHPQYSQKYRTEWEKMPELKDWLTPCTVDINKAYCKFCKATLNARLPDLRKHVKTMKHINAAKPFSCARQQKIMCPRLVSNSEKKPNYACM